MEMQQIIENLNHIKQRIHNAALRAQRDPNSIRLVAVSKFHPINAVQTVINQGHYIFGENRIQEATEKFTSLLTHSPDLKLHIIGPIQSNKILDAVKIAHTIETIDRTSLLPHLQKAIDKIGYCPKLFVQINTGSEPQKAGVLPKDANLFIEQCITLFGDAVQGVMGIPPQQENPIPHFQQLAQFAKAYHLPEISMGMSNDFETAILYGATFVRVGSAIFGDRPIMMK